MTDGHEETWVPWHVLPEAGFEVHGRTNAGLVPVRQTSASTFTVGSRFRFRNPTVEDRIVRHLAKVGAFADDDARRAAFRKAAGYGPANGPTDLASIPAFMRWLVNTYGDHSLAAVIHDKLITEKPNGGALRSDVVSDRFFREMLHACGMPFLLRWIVWTAVALRSRWSAGAAKRLKVVLWVASSVVGIGGTIALGAAGRPLAALGFGAAMLVVAAALWGRQWGAAVVAAVALPWIAPAALPVLVATLVLRGLDRAGRRFDRPLPTPPPVAAATGTPAAVTPAAVTPPGTAPAAVPATH